MPGQGLLLIILNTTACLLFTPTGVEPVGLVWSRNLADIFREQYYENLDGVSGSIWGAL